MALSLAILGRRFGQLRLDSRGVAALELALILGVGTTVMLNGIEISRYYYAKMELENAAQMAAQNVFRVCDKSEKLPATIRCSDHTDAIGTALQSTSLGSNVTLSTDYPTEAYYCVSTGGALIQVAAANETRPNDCSSVGRSSDKPGLYLMIQAQYTYTPIFDAITIGSRLPATVRSSTMTRLS
ncbi:TadE/TadG family type IV pilus assembly protein [Blastomonas sp.]|uniref:TadE/TadG family type IV pilus assembly protein n=1 Tax=Blastomonas sp. TaxID=1909299 RepID=UPI003593B53F